MFQGKQFPFKGSHVEKTPVPGYDSLISSNKKEIVVFDPSFILPTYIVQFESNTLRYEEYEEEYPEEEYMEEEGYY